MLILTMNDTKLNLPRTVDGATYALSVTQAIDCPHYELELYTDEMHLVDRRLDEDDEAHVVAVWQA